MRRSTTPAELAEFLRKMRHETGKTQDEVARAMKVSAEHIVRMESGRVEPRLTTVVRFLGALGSKLTLVVDTERPLAGETARTARPRRTAGRPKRADSEPAVGRRGRAAKGRQVI
jgi:transcriptional regulator with XRE-family HTH domain